MVKIIQRNRQNNKIAEIISCQAPWIIVDMMLMHIMKVDNHKLHELSAFCYILKTSQNSNRINVDYNQLTIKETEGSLIEGISSDHRIPQQTRMSRCSSGKTSNY